jgi:hypothetical protein
MMDAVDACTKLPRGMQGIGQCIWQTRWNRKLGTVKLPVYKQSVGRMNIL